MIDKIRIENFKAARNLSLRVAPLTILSGLNSSGKSTVLQAIASLRQSYKQNFIAKSLVLSGSLVQLGRFADVRSEDALGDSICISLHDSRFGEQKWVMLGDPQAGTVPFVEQPDIPPLVATLQPFQFLQADRVAPTTLYPEAPNADDEDGFLGPRGEYTADFLAKNGTKSVDKGRLCTFREEDVPNGLLGKAAPTDGLLDQVSGWFQQISPGATIETPAVVRGTDAISLQYSYTGRARVSKSKPYRPTNVGFGLTYCLPILTSCLAAPKGALLLLENPEAHLHPRGQTAIGNLIARCAQDGVQLIVETHSDHLLNGVRLAVKRGELSKENVVVHYFERDVETGESFVQSPAVLDGGRISNWPKGFFDEWDRGLDELLG